MAPVLLLLMVALADPAGGAPDAVNRPPAGERASSGRPGTPLLRPVLAAFAGAGYGAAALSSVIAFCGVVTAASVYATLTFIKGSGAHEDPLLVVYLGGWTMLGTGLLAALLALGLSSALLGAAGLAG